MMTKVTCEHCGVESLACDRCGSVGATDGHTDRFDPLGQLAFCGGCLADRERWHRLINDFAAECDEAWKAQKPMPPLPELW